MKNKAAVLFEGGSKWDIVETDLGDPQPGEVLVRVEVAGLCHSDEHFITGDMLLHNPEAGIIQLPMVGGHEGAGVVERVGEGVTSLEVGDHVVLSWIASCGRCRMCVTGFQMLCDQGANMHNPAVARELARHTYEGEIVFSFGQGTFSEYAVGLEASFIKVPKEISFEAAALVGCGVATGWGSAVNRAQVTPGDSVVVVGAGGLGSSAIQGAKLAGARHVIAIDPVQFKRDKALDFGATHTSASMEEAFPLVQELTWGLMADSVILTPSVLFGDMIEPAMLLTRKGGVCVATAVAPWQQRDVKLDLLMFAMNAKELKGTVYGNSNPRYDIPRLLKLYQDGLLKLDEMVTQRYSLEDVNQGYEDLRQGLNIRGVIVNS
jgi:S-(hydroxymethyl)glutathione dehydrogenase/alcohol dehydrogenase